MALNLNLRLECISFVLFCCCLIAGAAGQNVAGRNPTGPNNVQPQHQEPTLKQRPPAQSDAERHRIRLDISVSDASRNPAAGLDLGDFTILDNDQPQKIVAFQQLDPAITGTANLAKVLLVIDFVNSYLNDTAVTLDGVENFLRQNSGHLAHPMTILLLTESGLQVMSQSSQDGNALAEIVHAIPSAVHTTYSVAGGEAYLERYRLSVKTLIVIINREIQEPGRKMLVWTGPGWPLLDGPEEFYNARIHQQNFNVMAVITNGLRKTRMVICSPGGGSEHSFNKYLKPVKTPRDMNAADLDLQVLAVQTGGWTLDPRNGSRPEDQINECTSEFGVAYRLEFDPGKPASPEEYHSLKVMIDKPGLTARTIAEYYGEP